MAKFNVIDMKSKLQTMKSLVSEGKFLSAISELDEVIDLAKLARADGRCSHTLFDIYTEGRIALMHAYDTSNVDKGELNAAIKRCLSKTNSSQITEFKPTTASGSKKRRT